MEKIITWLIGIEKWAGRLYEACAQCVAADNPAAARLLVHLSQDEAQHAAYLEMALDCCLKSEDCPETIRLDQTTIRRAEAPLHALQKILDQGCPPWEALLEKVVQTEHSEFNDLFLYVVSTFKHRCQNMAHVAPHIQQHLRYIEKNIETLVPDQDWIAAIRSLPPVWQEKILVVEDEAPIAALLETFLARDGIVHTVSDGLEALEKIRQDYFAVIVSDVDMPVMNGWQLYQTAVREFPGIGQRCIFITGNPTTLAARHIHQEGLPLLFKPFSLMEIRDKVYALMECNTRPDCAGHVMA